MDPGDKGKNLICPIYEKPVIGAMSEAMRQQEELEKNDCIEDRCAWWEVNTSSCSINVLALNLRRLAQKK